MCVSSSSQPADQNSADAMKREVDSAAGFLVNILRLNERSKEVHPQVLDLFRSRIAECLLLHYTNHWFPEMPFRGSGYRCIRINGRLDPVIAQAGKSCGLPDSFLYSLFPAELTLWVDPSEVSYRIGENGSVCVLYSADSSSSPTINLIPPRLPSLTSSTSYPLYYRHHGSTSPDCGKEARRKLVFTQDAQNIRVQS